MSTLRANTLKPITSGNSLVLQGDSGGSGVSGPSIDSNGDVDFSQNTNAKVKLPSGGGIYESDGSTEILTESSGAVTLKNTAIDSTVTMSPNQSAVKTALNASGSAPIFAVRTWMNFDGLGTVTLRAAGNVTNTSSITHSSTGIYTIAFTTALEDDDYAVVAMCEPSVSNAGTDTFASSGSSSASQVQIQHFEAGTLRDSNTVTVIIVR